MSDASNASAKRWKVAHRDEHLRREREYARKRRALDPEKTRQEWRDYQRKRRVEKPAWFLAYYQEHRDVLRERSRVRMRANPLARRIAEARRRARKAGGGGVHTMAEWVALCWASGWCCLYCGCKLSEATAVQEHKVPLARGGTDDIQNIALSCSACNGKKHTMTDSEFMARREVAA